MSDSKAFIVRLSGRVTGVGFRYYASQYASGLNGLKGSIRNLGHGRVEAFIQGPEDSVNLMLKWLHKGPPMAVVEKIEIEDAEPREDAAPFNIEL